MAIVQSIRLTAMLIAVFLSAPAFASDQALASEFANCSVVYYMVERLSKTADDQARAHNLSARYNVYANALADLEFVRLEKAKARVYWREQMQLLVPSADRTGLDRRLIKYIDSCAKTSHENEKILKPRVDELKNRLLRQPALTDHSSGTR